MKRFKPLKNSANTNIGDADTCSKLEEAYAFFCSNDALIVSNNLKAANKKIKEIAITRVLKGKYTESWIWVKR